MRVRGRLSLLVGLLLTAGCGEAAPEAPAGLPVVSGDPELLALVTPLLPLLAERSGLPLLEPVRVERRTRQELLHHVDQRLDQDLPPEVAAFTSRAYALLGLVPEAFDLRGLLRRVYEEQVAGFYDPHSKTLFVLDDQPPGSLESILLHELVHALQDQHVALDSLTSPAWGNDRALAARAAIEGHATLVMLGFMAEAGGSHAPPEDLPALSSLLRPDEQALATQYPALAAAPLVLRETLLFPYVEGAEFVQALWRARGGRPAPFGEALPLSTEQVMEWDGTSPTEAPKAVEAPTPPGVGALHRNTLGALESGILLGSLTPEGWQGGGAGGWAGDQWVLVDAPGDGVSVIWASAWDDNATRDRHSDLLEAHRGSFPGPVLVVRRQISERPGILLVVGGEGMWDTLQGEEMR
jgi:hypothetical protein